ncbi:MAG: hypothetical protein ABR588_02565 [Sphingomicrobium sp.]
MSFHLKDPGATLDYAVDWGAEYLDDDAIASSSFDIAPVEDGGATIVGTANDFKIATVTVAGGLAGRQYRVTNHVVMASGREDERTIVLRVEQR